MLKEQVLALEEKGRHDDELIEALTDKIKNTSVESKPLAQNKPNGPVRIESKESIVEIKQLGAKVSNLSNDLNAKDMEVSFQIKEWR